MHFHNNIARILALVYLAFLLTSSQFPFLCLQTNGQMKLRAELKNPCCSKTQHLENYSSEMDSSELFLNGDSCGPCFDFTTKKKAEALSKFSELCSPGWIAFFGGSSFFQGCPSGEGVLFHGYLPPPEASKLLAIVRSTCLLI